jgi:glyoxylase-like metal-dependent hydrolase (beta-lactamase superfamily II)
MAEEKTTQAKLHTNVLESLASVTVGEPSASGAVELKQRGNDLLKQGKYDAAADAYSQAVATPGLAAVDAAPIHSNLSHAQLKLGEPRLALAAADAAVAARPEWHKAHFRRGEALFAARQYADARAAYQKAAGVCEEAGAAHEIKQASALCDEAAKGGLWFRQLQPGRDIALTPRADRPMEGLVFQCAKQMQNFIYLLGDARTRKCFVVDACWDTDGILAYVKRCKMELVGAVATHYHFDHTGGLVPAQMVAMVFGPFARDTTLCGLKEMRQAGLPVYIHATEVERIAKQCSLDEADVTPLVQGQKVVLGDGPAHLQVLHTPGHSGGSVCLMFTAGDGAGAHSIMVGDTIFPGSCGRLDLPDSDIDQMFDSLATLRALDDSLVVYPGHAYSGASTTIGREKANGLLRPFTREQWRQMMAK